MAVEVVSDFQGDRLFGGLTRPATVFGLPVEALLGIVGTTAIAFLLISIFGGNLLTRLLALGVGAVGYGVARLVCVKDPRAFRYVGLMLQTKGGHRTRGYWGSGSYAPVAHRKRH